MTDTERLDRLERYVLLSTRDADVIDQSSAAAHAALVRIVDEIRADHPDVIRRGNHLVIEST